MIWVGIYKFEGATSPRHGGAHTAEVRAKAHPPVLAMAGQADAAPLSICLFGDPSLNRSGEWCTINNKAPTTRAAEPGTTMAGQADTGNPASAEWLINNMVPTTSAAEEAEAPAAEEAEAPAAEEVEEPAAEEAEAPAAEAPAAEEAEAPGEQLTNQSVGEPISRHYSARSGIEALLGDDRHMAPRRSTAEPNSGIRWQRGPAGWQGDQTWWQQGGQQGWQWQRR